MDELIDLIIETREKGSVINSLPTSGDDLSDIARHVKSTLPKNVNEAVVFCTVELTLKVRYILAQFNAHYSGGVMGTFKNKTGPMRHLVDMSVYIDGVTLFFVPKHFIKQSIVIPNIEDFKPRHCLVIDNVD